VPQILHHLHVEVLPQAPAPLPEASTRPHVSRRLILEKVLSFVPEDSGHAQPGQCDSVAGNACRNPGKNGHVEMASLFALVARLTYAEVRLLSL
jgi:hypothetical protein